MIHIVDIDTTIANNQHRAALLLKTCRQCGGPVDSGHRTECRNCGSTESVYDQASWDNFLHPDFIARDVPEPEAQRVIKHWDSIGAEYHYLTGRNEALRSVTETWLASHFGFSNQRLIMRPTESEKRRVPASVYKEKVFLALREELGKDKEYSFYEDDPHVFTMYSQYGIVHKCPDVWEFIYPKGTARINEPDRNV